MEQPKIHRGGKGKNGKDGKNGKGQGRPAGRHAGRNEARFKNKLESGQFRYLNERLYSTTSDEAVELFRKDPALYEVYHRGFTQQTLKWPQSPVALIVDMVKDHPSEWVMGDFGCGTAQIARSLPHKVHSFDLCKTNELVTVANSANVPLEDGSLDVAIFCLSLMGTDFDRFLVEARRCLREDGHLIIAEVKSRFASEAREALSPGAERQDDKESARREKAAAMLGGLKQFKRILTTLGFKLVREDLSNTMFVMFELRKLELRGKTREQLLAATAALKSEGAVLKSCRYKKR